MRKRILIIIIAAVCAVALLAVLDRKHHMKPKTDVAAVERDIREHLPIGSSRAEVSAFLDHRGIHHSHIGQIKETPENSFTELAMIPDVSARGLVKSDIQIILKFDNTDSRLVSYSVREIATGP